jgi:DNA primase
MAQAARQLASISDEKLQDVRDRVDLVAIVQRRVPLKKSGRDWKGLCPFHGEKSPSFYVVPDKKIFHCFGCGATGDAIKFIMQLDGKTFREAVEGLAQEAGVELAPADPEESRRASRRAALAEVNEAACRFYERVLWEHPRGAIAREHLQKRGISEETAKLWRLGYAPSLWDALAKSLARGKVDPTLIEEAGLAVPRKSGKGSGSLYDRFRGRLIIPIRESGRIVAFGGRLLEGESDAKYLNSPETPLYNKGAVLFGLDRARDAVRREGVALFVEGYFDSIGLHQAGVLTAVATCGTALTEKHLELVVRTGARELVFLFDGDAAGIRAAQRASEIAAAAGVTARVLVPPGGEDPDETVLRLGVAGFRELIAAAQPSVEFLLDRALSELPKGASVEQRVRAVAAVEGIVKAAPNELARALYIEKVAEKIGISAEVVREALAGKPSKPAEAQKSAPVERPRPIEALPSAAARTELVILAHMLRSATLTSEVETSGAASRFSVAELRDVAERAFAHAHAGTLDVEALIASMESEFLRNRLASAMREVTDAGDTPDAERAHLLKLIASHEKTLAQEQAARKQRKPPPVGKIRS